MEKIKRINWADISDDDNWEELDTRPPDSLKQYPLRPNKARN